MTMRLARHTIAPALLVLLLAGGGFWWYTHFERVPDKVHTGLQGKARDDPYLAAKRLLATSGIRVVEAGPGAPPGAKFDALPIAGTLLLGDRRHVLMTPARVQRLLAWIDGGGHLIVEAEYPGRPDPLLSALGLGRTDLMRPGPASKSPAEGIPAADEPSASRPRPARLPRPVITDVTPPGAGRVLKVEFGAYQSLSDPRNLAQWRAADETGLRLVSYGRGAGRVTAASNFDWLVYRGAGESDDPRLQPPHIGKYDNAELLVRLARQNPAHASGALRLAWGDDDVSTWSWLIEHAWMALLAAGAALALWLWRVAPRFGPLEAEAAPAEQRLIRHVEATGRFYWKHLSPGGVYATLHAAFMQRLTERRPGLARRANAERNAELAQLIGARPDAVTRALDAPVRGTGEFIRDTALLQRLTQKL